MNIRDLRLKYKFETGNRGFQPIKHNDWTTDPMRFEYFNWLEENLVEVLNKLERLEIQSLTEPFDEGNKI